VIGWCVPYTHHMELIPPPILLLEVSPLLHVEIRAEIREEFRTSSGPSDAGGNPPSVTIHTWLECFNKQKPHSFEKATAPVDVENWISHMEKIFDVIGCEDAFKTRLAVFKFEGNALAWWKAYKQAKGGDSWLITVTWADFKKLFFLQFFPRAEQERLKRESTLNHLMCMSYTDVAQLANAARNYEILHERDDDDIEKKSGDRHQPTTQQSSHRNHSHNNDRHGSDRRGGSDNHRSSNNYSGNNNRNSGNGRDQRNRGQQSNRSANSGFQQSRGPSEGYSYPVCTTCGCRHPGECHRAAGTCFKCGQAGHLQKDCKKNTTASTSGQADKKPGASGRVFTITEDHAIKTSGTITGTLFIYGHAVFVLFDRGATHSVISSAFALRVTMTPTLLDHVLCISTPMQDSVRITHVYRNFPLQFDDKIHAINALPLDMCEFDIILGMDWLTEHHATIDYRSYRVIFGDIHAPKFIYHGSLPGKSMQIILALQVRTLLSYGCEGFLATIHDTTSDVPSIQDQLIVSEFPDVFPDELPGIPQVREVEFNIELIPGQNPSPRILTTWLR
nr:hypothetical protein [Tanacetum cinerariifolium]